MVKKNALIQLSKIADALDKKGEYKLANDVDDVLRRLAANPDDIDITYDEEFTTEPAFNKQFDRDLQEDPEEFDKELRQDYFDTEIDYLDHEKDKVLEKMKHTVDHDKLVALQKILTRITKQIKAIQKRDFERATRWDARRDGDFSDY